MSGGSWWDDFTGVFKQGLSGKNLGTMLGTGIAGYAINKSGLSSPNVPVVGYQGTVPEYTAVRERVPMQQDPNRRPGSSRTPTYDRGSSPRKSARTSARHSSPTSTQIR